MNLNNLVENINEYIYMYYNLIPSKFVLYKNEKINQYDDLNDIASQLVSIINKMEIYSNELYRDYIDEKNKITVNRNIPLRILKYLLATYININDIIFDLKIELCKIQENLFGSYRYRYGCNNEDKSCYRMAYITIIENDKKLFNKKIKDEEMHLTTLVEQENNSNIFCCPSSSIPPPPPPSSRPPGWNYMLGSHTSR